MITGLLHTTEVVEVVAQAALEEVSTYWLVVLHLHHYTQVMVEMALE